MGFSRREEPFSVADTPRCCCSAQPVLRLAGEPGRAHLPSMTGEEPNSEIVDKVVLPILSVAEREFAQALSRISLDDMVQCAVVNGHQSGVPGHEL